MARLKVLQICSQFPPDIGGGGAVVYYLSQGLARNECEIHVLTSGHVTDKNAKKIDAFLSGQGIFTHRVPHEFDLKGLELEATVQHALNLANEERIDIIHAHHFGAIYIGSVLRNALEIPLVASEHKTPIRIWDPELTKRQSVYAVFKQLTITNVDLWIAYSDFFKREIKLLNPKVKVTRIYPGVEIIRRKDAPSANTNVVIVVSRMDKRKRLERVVEAIAQFNKQMSSMKLRVLFTGRPQGAREREYKTYVAEEARRSHVDARFRMFDFEKARSAIGEKFACVLPSDREGLGLAALESMASGTPIVAANIPGINEVVRDGTNGLLFSPEVEGDLAQRLISLAKDGELRGRLVQGGYDTVDGVFRLDNSARKHIVAYKKLIKSK